MKCVKANYVRDYLTVASSGRGDDMYHVSVYSIECEIPHSEEHFAG